MANVTAAYAIAVRADLDATGVTTGAEVAEQALRDMATTADVAASDIDTSLATDVPASVDTSAVSLTTKASKFKAVGTELGTNLAGGIAGGASGPEAVASTGSALSGLLAASAATGIGAAAAIGIGLGAAVITNIAKGVGEKKQEMIDAYNAAFREVEVNAKDTARDIKAAILDAFTFDEAIEAFGGGDIDAGFAKINALVRETGANFNEIVDIIRGDINPANRDTLQLLREQGKESQVVGSVHGQIAKTYTEEARDAQRILQMGRDQAGTNDRLLDQKKQEQGYQAHIADDSERAADAQNRNADAAARTRDNLDQAARAAARLNAVVANGLGDDVA